MRVWSPSRQLARAHRKRNGTRIAPKAFAAAHSFHAHDGKKILFSESSRTRLVRDVAATIAAVKLFEIIDVEICER